MKRSSRRSRGNKKRRRDGEKRKQRLPARKQRAKRPSGSVVRRKLAWLSNGRLNFLSNSARMKWSLRRGPRSGNKLAKVPSLTPSTLTG